MPRCFATITDNVVKPSTSIMLQGSITGKNILSIIIINTQLIRKRCYYFYYYKTCTEC